MKAKVTRRRFIRSLGATASATLVAPSLLDLDLGWGQVAKPFVRKNVKNLTEDSQILKTYNDAIAAMKKLAFPANPLNWCYQAAIHRRPTPDVKFMNTPCGPGVAGEKKEDGWNGCRHYDAWFLPWHRIYLYWFERIVREITKDKTWALPYWDWENDPFLPKPFQKGGKLKELYVDGRNKAVNDGTGAVAMNFAPLLPLNELQLGVIVANANKVFSPNHSVTDFSELIEELPHDLVHNRVGSPPTTDGTLGLMRNPATAAEDPIFWLHHANIDRLWIRWLELKGGRQDPLGDKKWGRDKKFIFFDEKGVKKDMEVSCDYVDPKMKGYVYESDENPKVAEKCTVDYAPSCTVTEEPLIYEAIQSPAPPFVLPEQSDPVYFTFTIDSEFREKVLNILDDPTKTIYLKLTDIWTPTEPGVAWDIYLGPGWGPSLTPPFFVGAMALFGGGVQDEQLDHFMPGEFTCAVNNALQESLQSQLNVKMNVTFLPAGVVVNGEQTHPAPVSRVSIGHAQLIVQTVICS